MGSETDLTLSIIGGVIGALLTTIITVSWTKIQNRISARFKTIRPKLANDLQEIAQVEILMQKPTSIDQEIPFQSKFFTKSEPRMIDILRIESILNYPRRIWFKINLNYLFICLLTLLILIIMAMNIDVFLQLKGLIASNGGILSKVIDVVEYIFKIGLCILYLFKMIQILVLHISERIVNELFKYNGIKTFNTDLVWFGSKR